MAQRGQKPKAKGRKIGRAKTKCERYRNRIGKPNGPGKPGNKAGKNKLRKTAA